VSAEGQRYLAAELAAALGGRLEGEPGDVQVTRLVSPAGAKAGAAEAYVVVAGGEADVAALAAAPRAPALVVAGEGLDLSPLGAVPVARVADTRLALARLTALLDTRPSPATGERSDRAYAHPTATLGEGVTLHPGAVVMAGARVGDRTAVGPGSVVGEGAVVGADCVLHANVTLYDGVRLGDRVVLHSGCVVGADGFGYAASPTGAVKVRHLGGVVIGDDVEVGANTAIDRGTLDDTVVGAGTKIDNLCQVGHNVRIGRSCLIAGKTAIGGSTVIGDGVIIGGAVSIADHVKVGSGARLAGGTGVSKDVPPGETWAGLPARPYKQWVRGLYLQDRLEEIWRVIKGMDRR
jgi:UDP-3-O-[3-hydroxymyristoyl] glucosamine N-acyltransferase